MCRPMDSAAVGAVVEAGAVEVDPFYELVELEGGGEGALAFLAGLHGQIAVPADDAADVLFFLHAVYDI